MHVVALLTGGAMGDAEIAALAADLGIAPYDARMAVAQGYPSIVATRGSAEQAGALAAQLRTKGRDAVLVDTADVILSGAMIEMTRFTLGVDALVGERAKEPLPYADVLCLLRATHRKRSATETTTTETRFSAARSLLTGGLSNTTTVTKHSIESAEAREAVLYVFRRSGSTPWILREQGTHYEGLGAVQAAPQASASLLARTQVENFATTVRLLRERAPHATYDERLIVRSRVAERSAIQGTAAKSTVTSSSSAGVDLLAHLLAMALGAPATGRAYR